MIQVNLPSFRVTASNLKLFRKEIEPEVAAEALRRAGAVLHKAVVKNISLKDHSLEALAAMDHPYARRHGRIKIHQSKPYVVHDQSGEMKRALRTLSGARSFRIWFDLAAAPHAQHVIQGTRVMLARDVLWDTAKNRTVNKKMRREIVNLLGRDLRSQAVVRFKRTATGPSATGT